MRSVGGALLALVLTGGCAGAMHQDDVDRIMSDYAGPDVPGASVLVVHRGRVIFSGGYGSANLEQPSAATPATHYRLASVTKQFTAAAILILAERGKLSIDDPIRRFFPALPSWADPITVKHLLTHTSGIIDYEDVIPSGTSVQLKDADVLTLLERQSGTYFPAGTSWRYSNSGYALLALIVEKASGSSFAAFLEANIFRPLRMTTTVAHEEGISVVPRRAYGYGREGSHWRRTDQSLTSAVLGDGGIYTSTEDLVHWLEALDDGLFAEASVPRVDTSDAGVRYGYGWRVGDQRGRHSVWHTGETIGFRNALVRFPDLDLAVVVLTNRDEGSPLEKALAIAELYF